MKLFQDYKKLYNVFFLIILVGLVVWPGAYPHAQTAEEIRNKINEKDTDILRLEEEIAAYQKQLDAVGQQKNSLASSIKELDLTKKKLTADIALTQNKIDRANLTIGNLSTDIGTKEENIKINLDSIKLGIKNMSELEQDDIVENILSQNDFTALWNDIDNMITVRERLRDDIILLQQRKGDLEDTRQSTIEARAELTKLKTQLADQEKIVVQNTNEKNKLLKQTQNSEAAYQRLLQERIAQRDAFEKELRDYESQLKYILDPSKLPAGRVLSWPLENVFVTQLFGKTVDSVRLYASGSHSGVDFRASVGTPVLSMADGTVLGVGDTDLTCPGASFGKFVFIQYDNGLSSTFGHLSLIKAVEGTKVKRGEIIGYSGATGHVTGPHLHISLYAPQAAQMDSKPSAACNNRIYRLPVAPVNAYLDAMQYLPPYP